MARIPAKKVEQVNKSSHFTTDINTDSIDFTTDKDKYTFDNECYIGTDKLVKESEVSGGIQATETDMEVATDETKFVSALRFLYGFAYHLENYIFNPLLTFAKTIIGAINELKSITIYTKEPTGFISPNLVDVSYNGTTRKVTLTGTVDACYRGVIVEDIIDGFESEAHDIANGTYFLQHDGTNFIWVTTGFDFTNILICIVYRDGANFCLRECHGLMQWQSHFADHYTVGTWLESGGDMSNFVLSSTTAANRRPFISSTLINDEDCPTLLPALSTNSYTRLQLENANNTTFVQEQTDIIALSTNRPYYNQWNGSAWVQTLFANNAYGKIFVMAIPVTSDAECQKNRYIFIQPQTTSTNLETIKGVQTSSVNLGHISTALAEYCFIGEIIVRYTAGNWQLIQVNKLTGTRANQIAAPTGSFLSSVTTDTTLSGNGTASEPLKLSEPIKPKLVEFQGKTDWGNSGTSKTITEITTKMNFLTLTGNCILTLQEFEYETECISFMIRVAQDSVGGRSLTINKSTGTAAINLSEFDFSSGTIGQYCWVTVLWDTEVLVFTSSKYI